MATGLRVLVVDDSALIRRHVVEALSQIAGVATVEEANGPEPARQVMDTCRVDVVVLDIRMPGGSGIDLLRAIKAAAAPPVVVMLTNYPLSPYREICLEAGADAFLDKSADICELVGMVERLAGRIEVRS